MSKPTFLAPKSFTSWKNFSVTKALSGAVYHAASPPAVAAAIAAVATIVLPLPVGVVNKTLLPSTSSRMASSCASYSSTPLTSIDH